MSIGVSAAQLDAGSLDSRFDKNVWGAIFAEPAIELANRHSGSLAKSHVDGLLKVVGM